MKLYCFPVAPNPTRVRLYLAEKRAAGAKIDVVEVAVNLPAGEQREPDHLARNPAGALPVLELDDGSFLSESLAIIEYLEELCPEPPMIGRNAQERARVREAERFVEMSVLKPIAYIVHTTNSPLGFDPIPEAAAMFEQSLQPALRIVDERLSDGRPFLMGDRVTLADCTLAAALQFGRFRGVEVDSAFEQLARWDVAYRARAEVSGVLIL